MGGHLTRIIFVVSFFVWRAAPCFFLVYIHSLFFAVPKFAATDACHVIHEFDQIQKLGSALCKLRTVAAFYVGQLELYIEGCQNSPLGLAPRLLIPFYESYYGVHVGNTLTCKKTRGILVKCQMGAGSIFFKKKRLNYMYGWQW